MSMSPQELHAIMQEFYDTPEGKTALREIAEDFRQRTGKDGHCVSDNCRGLIVREIGGVSSGSGYIGGTPHCSCCRRRYPLAPHAPLVGHQAFKKLMNTPYGL